MDNETRIKSVSVHKSFFDQARAAIDHGYYLEAVMYDYAAIEGRLEVICGLLGCPCNKELDDNKRRSIKISQRIKCLKALYKKHPACKGSTTKITNKYWTRLSKWITDRNIYVHGLYKNPQLYSSRLDDRYRIAKEGVELARALYNEAKRIRRLEHSHPERMEFSEQHCKGKTCFETEK